VGGRVQSSGRDEEVICGLIMGLGGRRDGEEGTEARRLLWAFSGPFKRHSIKQRVNRRMYCKQA